MRWLNHSLRSLQAWLWPNRYPPRGVTVRAAPDTPEALEEFKREFMANTPPEPIGWTAFLPEDAPEPGSHDRRD